MENSRKIQIKEHDEVRNKMFEVSENAEKKIQIKLLNNKYFYENFNLNFSLQNKKTST